MTNFIKIFNEPEFPMTLLNAVFGSWLHWHELSQTKEFPEDQIYASNCCLCQYSRLVDSEYELNLEPNECYCILNDNVDCCEEWQTINRIYNEWDRLNMLKNNNTQESIYAFKQNANALKKTIFRKYKLALKNKTIIKEIG